MRDVRERLNLILINWYVVAAIQLFNSHIGSLQKTGKYVLLR